MITQSQLQWAQDRPAKMLVYVGIDITPIEPQNIQAAPEGAIVSEFSSTSRDESNGFTDPRIRWIPEIAD